MGIDNNNNQNGSLDLNFVRDLNSTRELDFGKMFQAEKDAKERKSKNFKNYLDGVRDKANAKNAAYEEIYRKIAEDNHDEVVVKMEEEIEAAKAKAEEEVRARWAKDDPRTEGADPKRQKIDQALLGLLRDYKEKNS